MDAKEIEKLLKEFDHSNLTELRVDGQVYFSKLDRPSESKVTNNADKVNVAQTNATPSKQPVASSTDDDAQIKAPLVGLVYFAPSPKKPAYKKVGDHVKKGETVCVIEAMKVINEVKSPVTGTITKKLVSDGDMVEYDEAIFNVEED